MKNLSLRNLRDCSPLSGNSACMMKGIIKTANEIGNNSFNHPLKMIYT